MDRFGIIIFSPSYHRIVHKAKPTFDREQQTFNFLNGIGGEGEGG